jgi:hypothetical protein
MDNTCTDLAEVGVRRDGSPIEVECGRWWGGRKAYCTNCEKSLMEQYPQGWIGYPGDKCRHGTYVGGCGVDLICGACEIGYDG